MIGIKKEDRHEPALYLKAVLLKFHGPELHLTQEDLDAAKLSPLACVYGDTVGLYLDLPQPDVEEVRHD